MLVPPGRHGSHFTESTRPVWPISVVTILAACIKVRYTSVHKQACTSGSLLSGHGTHSCIVHHDHIVCAVCKNIALAPVQSIHNSVAASTCEGGAHFHHSARSYHQDIVETQHRWIYVRKQPRVWRDTMLPCVSATAQTCGHKRAPRAPRAWCTAKAPPMLAIYRQDFTKVTLKCNDAANETNACSWPLCIVIINAEAAGLRRIHGGCGRGKDWCAHRP